MNFICKLCEHEFEADRPSEGERLKCPMCGHEFQDSQATTLDDTPAPQSSALLLPDTQVAGFIVEEKIGVGAMGYVYRARQISLDRIVALKVLPPAFSERPAFVERFHEESAALSSLNHPNIVTIIERGNVGKTYFFAMELIDGPPLTKLMYQQLSDEQIVRIAHGTAAALEYAHAQGIVHRDIKPSNIIINSQNVVKVADFGLAGIMTRHPSADATEHGNHVGRMGTPSYMSPEQKDNPLAVDGRTDIFSLGVVLFELLTGHKPELPLEALPSEISETADPRMDPIVKRCLEIHPQDRYAHASELLRDIRRYETELRLAPRCPSCGTVGPVREQTCVNCGEDLSEFFDLCPECSKPNRREVRFCLSCGADLERSRTVVSQKVSLMLDHADRLRIEQSYDEALQILEEVRGISGKAFDDQRDRAQRLRDLTITERRTAAKKAYMEAKRLLRERRFVEAIEMLKSIPPSVKDTSKAVATARKQQAEYVAQRKSAATVTLIIFALCLLLILVTALFAVL